MTAYLSKFFALCFAVLVLVSAANIARADDEKARMDAAVAYEKVVPVDKLMNDMMTELEKNPQLGLTPEELSAMKKSLNDSAPALREKMLEAMVKHFTLPEINAITAFYKSPEGASIMAKMPVYMNEFMPFMQQQVIDVVQKTMEARQAKAPKS